MLFSYPLGDVDSVGLHQGKMRLYECGMTENHECTHLFLIATDSLIY